MECLIVEILEPRQANLDPVSPPGFAGQTGRSVKRKGLKPQPFERMRRPARPTAKIQHRGARLQPFGEARQPGAFAEVRDAEGVARALVMGDALIRP